MSDPSLTPPNYSSSSKSSFWTTGKKIIAAILIVIVAASVIAAGAYYGLPSSTNTSKVSSVCSNGATNYPSCTVCQSGHTLVSGSCQNNCSNGATNPTACNICSSGQTLVNGTCKNNCTNGATNPTACNICPSGQVMVGGSCVRNCSNTASNPPACDNILAFSIDYSPHSPDVGQEVSFYVLSQRGGIAPLYFTWTFGDGSTGTSSTALGLPGTTTHTYQSAGTFMVVVTARDSGSPQQTFEPTHVAIMVKNPVCQNGADNYPDCNRWTTSMTLTCGASSIMGHGLGSASCEVKVTSQAPTTPTGSVGFVASLSCWTNTPACDSTWNGNGIPCTLTILTTDTSYCTITKVSTTELSGTMNLTASYGGDTTHKSSSTSHELTIVAPPAKVTVSGSVSAQSGCVGCSVTSMTFYDPSTSQTLAATVSGNSYTITLTNLHDYGITINWAGTFGHGSCTMTLMLNQSTDALTADYQCQK